MLIGIAVILPLIAISANAALNAEPGAVTEAEVAPDRETSRLPNVLIIGDSISLGYTDDVRVQLAGQANVFRAPGNSGPSSCGVECVDEWIAEHPGNWSVIHFNFGLHDIKLAPSCKDDPYVGGHQVTPDQYEANLRSVVSRLKMTGARLIFATTTSVPAGSLDPPRTRGDELAYNDIAVKIMTASAVAIDDLYNVALPVINEIQLNQNVHFTSDGYAMLAKAVALSINSALSTTE